MQKCLICLSLRKALIRFNTIEWKNLQINFLIDKHLWPMEYDQESGVCRKCWQKLASFHEFFVDVQKSHKVLVLKNFNTIQNEEFQKVLKEFYNDKKVHNVPKLESEILQHTNYIRGLIVDPLTEPEVLSEPIDDNGDDDVTIDKNPNQLNNSIESETQDLEKNPLDLNLSLENKEKENVFKELDDNNDDDVIYNKNTTNNIANTTDIEINDLENSLADLIASLGNKDITKSSEDILTQTDELNKPTEKYENTQKNLKEKAINDDDDDDNSLENDFCDSGSSWANDESESEESSKELENTKNKTNETDINHLNKLQNSKEDELSDFEIGDTMPNTQENKVDAFIAKHLKLICCICQKPMETFSILTQHFEKEHNTPGYVMCCDKKFNRRWTLHDHLKLHNDPNHFKCSECNEVFSSRGGLAIHTKNQHEEVFEKSKYRGKMDKHDMYIAKHYKITCCLCDIPMQNFFELSKHFEKEHDVSAYVMCCDKKISQRSRLLDHLIVHNNPNYFKCSQCNEIFENRLQLTQHMRLHKEGGKKKYQCNICNALLKGGGQLTIHKAKHLTEDEKKHVCPICGKKFAFKHRLRVHTRIVHEKVNQSVCEICGISYSSSESLKNHMIKRHMDKPAPTVACDICGLKLSSSSVLTRHKRIRHSKDIKEYTCDVCSKVSVGLYAHKWHATLHNRKNKCQICGKCFVKPFSLRNHMATHTGGEAPYKCPWCPKTFNSHGNYSTHRKQKHYKEWLELRRSKYVDGKLPSDEEEK